MRKSGKKKIIAILSAVLALVLAVQAIALTAAKFDTAEGSENIEAGVTREFMDAKPQSSSRVVTVIKKPTADDSAIKKSAMKPVSEQTIAKDIEAAPQDMRVLDEAQSRKLIEIAKEKIAEEKVEVAQDELVYIPLDEAAEEDSEIKELGLGIVYDPTTGLLYGVDGHGILYIGFDYDSEQGIFYNPKYPWQRLFGYCELYDNCAPYVLMFFDTQRFKFEYEEKDWMIQIWKGQYMAGSGAEIGIYTKSPDREIEFYNCVSDEDCLKMSFDLYKNGKLFFHREDESHWWLTGYAPLTTTTPEEFELRASITCKSAEMAKAFAGALEEYGYVLGKTYWVNGAEVSLNW